MSDNKLTFKEEMIQNFIPAIERMIEKEKVHYEYLETHDVRLFPMVEVFLAESESFLKHLNNRLIEYKEYANKLP